MDRRNTLKVLAGSASLLALGCDSPPKTSNSSKKDETMSKRMPAVFLPHGGGPWPFVNASTFGPEGMYDGMKRYMERLHMIPPERPRAMLVISAHWEEEVPTVMASAKPPMYYDYHGFAPQAYEVQWPAPGEPEVAALVRERLEAAGLGSAANVERGFDHGVFVPLKLAYPDADVPTFQLSLKRGLDPADHIAMGRALAPLRDQGIFLIGSGMSYHNMRGFFGRVPGVLEHSRAFDEWLAETVSLEASRREQRLVEWLNAPHARACHPREEHLLPLMVIAGAAEDDLGTTPYREVVMRAHVSAAHFG